MIVEQIISDTIMAYLGNPIWVGILILLFFVVWVAFMRARLEVALLGLIPAFILASAFIPGLLLVGAMASGLLLGLILLRIGVR